MSTKSRNDRSTNTSSAVNCIFQQPWWLDAVTVDPQRWDAVEIFKNDRLVARLPYFMKKKMGLTLLTTPRLTPLLGPWIEPSSAKYSKQLALQKDLMTSLIRQLPPHDYFCQCFHYSITNWLPFYWQGFSGSTSYTYTINRENLNNLAQVWAGFQENIRTKIRKAQKQVIVRTDLDIERFLDIHWLTFQRQGKIPPYSREFVKRLDAACIEQEARRVFFAEDAKGQIYGVLYIVWDENSVYGLMSGADPENRNNGANSLLLWEAIKFAAQTNRKFDFGGSVIESIERFFRAFGAKQTPILYVTRMSRRLKVLSSGRDMLKAIVGR